MRVPDSPLIERVTVTEGLDVADDWIVEHAGPGDVVITSDIPLADRCVKRGARVLAPTGRPFTEASIGNDLATRNLMTELRDTGQIRGGGRAVHQAGPLPLPGRARHRHPGDPPHGPLGPVTAQGIAACDADARSLPPHGEEFHARIPPKGRPGGHAERGLVARAGTRRQSHPQCHLAPATHCQPCRAPTQRPRWPCGTPPTCRRVGRRQPAAALRPRRAASSSPCRAVSTTLAR